MVKILLVEDNELNRDMLSRRLTKRGFEIVMAFDGQQGIEMVKSEKPDIILMDLNMPVLNGWEAIKILKGDEALKHIPIIAITAHAMSEDREKTLALGCNGYETKPIDIDKLVGLINNLVKS